MKLEIYLNRVESEFFKRKIDKKYLRMKEDGIISIRCYQKFSGKYFERFVKGSDSNRVSPSFFKFLVSSSSLSILTWSSPAFTKSLLLTADTNLFFSCAISAKTSDRNGLSEMILKKQL